MFDAHRCQSLQKRILDVIIISRDCHIRTDGSDILSFDEGESKGQETVIVTLGEIGQVVNE